MRPLDQAKDWRDRSEQDHACQAFLKRTGIHHEIEHVRPGSKYAH